jgi:hypothetical protein
VFRFLAFARIASGEARFHVTDFATASFKVFRLLTVSGIFEERLRR